MESNKKNNKRIIVAILILILGGGVIFSAIKIYQNSTKPISPNVPDSSFAQTTTPEGCIPCDGIFFTVSAQSAPTATPTLVPTNTPTAILTPIPTSTPKPTSTPIPTATTIPGQPTSTPIPTATPTTAKIAQVNPTTAPSFGGTTVNPTVRPTSTPKPVSTTTLPDAGISYPTLMLILSGSLLLFISLIII